MTLVFWVILALSALRSGDADGCTSPYDNGPYTVQNVPLTVPIAQSLRFLWMAVPTVGGNVEGKFPVVQFQHGFLIMNTCYSQIISHIASYGFIVVAPQVNSLASFGLRKNLRVKLCFISFHRVSHFEDFQFFINKIQRFWG
jgi:predicted dienelactone hydrolase